MSARNVTFYKPHRRFYSDVVMGPRCAPWNARCILGMAAPIAILGGTGGLGRALALRACASGLPVVIGSRAVEKACAAAAELRTQVPDAQIVGRSNAQAAECGGLTVLSVPFRGVGALIPTLAQALGGRVLVETVVPLRVLRGFAELEPIPGAASVGEWLQAVLPGVRVVSAFKTVPAATLADVDRRARADVLVCGDDEPARTSVLALVGQMAGLRAVDAGTARNARYVEAVTALLVNLNLRHRARTSVAITGLDDESGGTPAPR